MKYFLCFYFFNEPATTEIYTYRHTLSLHDALPIFDTAEPAAPDRPGKRPAAMDGRWRTRWRLLRQVVRMRTVLNAGGSCSSRHEGRFTDNPPGIAMRSEEHTSELQSLMRISYAVFCLKKTNTK